jgi:hypothetical protein
MKESFKAYQGFERFKPISFKVVPPLWITPFQKGK